MISVYGKLPISKEYLRHNCHDGLPLRFRDWMDRGFDHASHRSLLPPGREARRVYYAGPRELGGALSVMAPSNDASGTREFPFAVLVPDRRPVNGEGRFAALDDVWSGIEGLFDALQREPDNDAFFARVRDAEDLTGEGEPVTEAVSVVLPWVERLFRFDPVDLFVRALWRLRVLRPHLDQPEPGHQRIRVPIDRTLPLGPQLDVWRTLLGHLHPLFERAPSVFAPRSVSANRPKPGSAWVVFGEPRADDFGAALGGEMGESRGVDLVDNEGRLPVDGFSDFRERLEAGPLREGADVDELVRFELAR
ncbi:MAG: DUF2094 domain-containing protein [Planctomycetes bacterium]|nr:DUF2094 domain-containing protein [Planctomycetota bacterium]